MSRTAPSLQLLWLWPVAACAAQVLGGAAPSVGTLGFDTSNMKVTVTMDRQVYLPGEVAQLTIEVSNPGSVPVRTLTPFTTTGCLYDHFARNGNVGWPGEYCVAQPVDASNTTTFQPGEIKRLVINSYDPPFDGRLAVIIGEGVADMPGEYGVTYWYGTTKATARFAVAEAQLEADAVARVHDILYSDNPELAPPKPIPAYVHVLALRSDGVSYVCVQQTSVTQGQTIEKGAMIATHPSFDYKHVNTILATPFKRVAESANPITNLSVTSDSDENLAIDFTDPTGRRQTLHYLASYPAYKSH